ncbi:threonine--tRNA ligase [Alloacidobacterium dinghuense]|uniref:Threonine--tRNA ligase n=1 Tax=Alloacidobacterium dinghuense TaxID=2763107 RepID=A0A7G8BG98_9BACT|nr:threonine--tRNA ligase [Alloacidobacterium dinghuense]QNI31568.1 threonine--tRNA ligase [Alloacidobacterium dinghuense]
MSSSEKLIRVQLPDGSEKELPAGSTPLDVANSISPRLGAAAIVARIKPLNASATAAAEDSAEAAMYGAENTHAEHLADLSTPLNEDVSLQVLTEKDPDALKVVRHSAAHVLATAVLELFPETKLGHGPATDSGFFYDFYRPTPFTPEDLKLIEGRMAEVVARDEKFVREWEPREEGLAQFKAGNDFMKLHFVEKFTKPDDEISLYRNGKFVDFCRGPHVPSTGRVKAFKVMSLSGAYWLGDEKNPQLQRIYGTAFFSRKDLDEYLERIEDAKRRDHRRLGKELELFTVSEEVGAGLPLWLPKGATIRRLLEEYILGLEREMGYEHVYTPSLAKVDLYVRSGHWAHYHEDMFPPMDLETEQMVLRPMNCPHHILVYESKLHSYRDLPVRLAELGTMYRYERSGALSGLSRVRCMTLNDAHIFCSPDQIKEEFSNVMKLVERAYRDLGITKYSYRLSLRDPANKEKYVDNDEMWELGERVLREAMDSLGLPYRESKGDAAFYGPKLDIQLADVMGHEETYSTVQVDFHLPSQFELKYTGADGNPHRPVMIHRAIVSTMERMVSYLIELYAGAFPLWLAPVQIGLVPISERHLEYAKKVQQQLQMAGMRVELDSRNEKMNAKIRDFTMQKVPYVLIMGDKEAEANAISVRTRGKGDQGSQPLDEFIVKSKKLVEEKSAQL